MKSEYVVLVGSVGAASGAVAHSSGFTTGNAYIDAGIGIVIAAAGFFTDVDYASDFAEGFGIGYFLDSVL